MTRTRLDSAWKAAGARMLKKTETETPDCVVIDLGSRNALQRISETRAAFPGLDVIAFGPHLDGDALKAAKAAGATDLAARSSVVERVLRRMAAQG
jgi:DNA-binding NarL/FixJ family response regulator